MADINDILGNERVKEHFIAAVHHKKISHAYIIEGDKGSGKKMLAAAFSKILQCETRQKTEEERACNLSLIHIYGSGRCTLKTAHREVFL